MRYLKSYKIFESVGDDLSDIFLEVNDETYWKAKVWPDSQDGKWVVIIQTVDEDEEYELEGLTPAPVVIESIERSIDFMNSEGFINYGITFELGLLIAHKSPESYLSERKYHYDFGEFLCLSEKDITEAELSINEISEGIRETYGTPEKFWKETQENPLLPLSIIFSAIKKAWRSWTKLSEKDKKKEIN